MAAPFLATAPLLAGAAGAAAAAAYRAVGGAGGPAPVGTVSGAAGQEEGSDFSAALRRAVEGAVERGRSADVTTTAALLGQGSVTDVVLAVSAAELALQTAVAVRDRVVAAYQEVMRMPI
jgi:flagellar hook-basal body complex protein FliE